MTITINETRNEYTATAGQTEFTYTFKIFDSTDLNVYQTPAGQTANDTTDLITAYSVSGVGNEDGGTVTLNSGASAGDLITIVSDIPSSRTTDYQVNGDFIPETVNNDFDRVVSLVKQVEDIANRSLALPESQQGPKPLTLPVPVALQYLRWKADESGLENNDLASLGAPTVTDLVIYNQGGTGAIDRTVTVKLQEEVSVEDFGALGDGVTVNTTAFQAAVDHVESAGGGTVFIPPGEWVLDDTITVDSDHIRIRGAGLSTIIKPTGDYGDVFFFTGNDTTGVQILYVGLSDMYIDISTARTSGAMLNLNGVVFADFKNLWFRNGFNGIVMGSSSQLVFDGIYHLNNAVSGQTATNRRLLHVKTSSGNYTLPHGGGIFFTNFNLRGSASVSYFDYACEINAIDGIWFNNGHFGGGGIANIQINADTSGTLLNYIYMTNVMSDINVGNGLIYKGSAIIGSSHQYSNCNFSGGGNAATGIHVESGATFAEILFNNTIIEAYSQRGLWVESATFRKASYTGLMVTGNSLGNTNVYPGIEFGASCGWCNITGGYSGYTGQTYTNTDSDHSYGIVLDATSTRLSINNFDVSRNQSGGISGEGDTTVKMSNINSIDAASVASAATITVPKQFEYVAITGTTNITSITPRALGDMIVLKFNGVLTVTDGSNLKLSGNFVTSLSDTLTLICDGTDWYETSRSVN